MTISRNCIAVAVGLLVAAGQAAGVGAQIINASSPTTATTGGSVQTAAGSVGTEQQQGGWLPVSWQSVSLPKVKMPKFSVPKISMPKWPTNADGSAVSPFAPITAGASKVSAGTKKAWQGAKEMFSFGSGEKTPRSIASANSSAEPSFWQRMAGKQPEPQGPQTVAEFMSQPRVGR